MGQINLPLAFSILPGSEFILWSGVVLGLMLFHSLLNVLLQPHESSESEELQYR